MESIKDVYETVETWETAKKEREGFINKIVGEELGTQYVNRQNIENDVYYEILAGLEERIDRKSEEFVEGFIKGFVRSWNTKW